MESPQEKADALQRGKLMPPPILDDRNAVETVAGFLSCDLTSLTARLSRPVFDSLDIDQEVERLQVMSQVCNSSIYWNSGFA